MQRPLAAVELETGLRFEHPRSLSRNNSVVVVNGSDGRVYVVKTYTRHPEVRDLQQLRGILDELVRRGIPMPEYRLLADLGSGQEAILYPLVAGSPVTTLTRALVEEVIGFNARQADVREAQPGVSRWWSFIVDTVVHGGPGYCVRSTLETDDLTRPLLGRIDALLAGQDLDIAPPGDRDVVHLDLSGANMLVNEAGQIVAIIDWDGARFGDRAFDLVSLAASSAAAGGSASALDLLWDEITAVTTSTSRLVYVCHLAIRHVDWALRHGGDVAYECHNAAALLDRLKAL